MPTRRPDFETADTLIDVRNLRVTGWVSMSLALLIAAFALGVFGPGSSSATAQSTVINKTYKKAANSELRVVRVFDGAMPSGVEPFQIRVRNRTQKPMRFTLSFDFGSGYSAERRYQSSFTIVADAGGESIHQLLVPVAPDPEQGRLLLFQFPALGQFARARQSVNESQQPARHQLAGYRHQRKARCPQPGRSHHRTGE